MNILFDAIPIYGFDIEDSASGCTGFTCSPYSSNCWSKCGSVSCVVISCDKLITPL